MIKSRIHNIYNAFAAISGSIRSTFVCVCVGMHTGMFTPNIMLTI